MLQSSRLCVKPRRCFGNSSNPVQLYIDEELTFAVQRVPENCARIINALSVSYSTLPQRLYSRDISRAGKLLGIRSLDKRNSPSKINRREKGPTRFLFPESKHSSLVETFLAGRVYLAEVSASRQDIIREDAFDSVIEEKQLKFRRQIVIVSPSRIPSSSRGAPLKERELYSERVANSKYTFTSSVFLA